MRRLFQRFRVLRGEAEGRVSSPREGRARHGHLIEQLERERGRRNRYSERVHTGTKRGCSKGGPGAVRRARRPHGDSPARPMQSSQPSDRKQYRKCRQMPSRPLLHTDARLHSADSQLSRSLGSNAVTSSSTRTAARYFRDTSLSSNTH